MAKGRKRRAIRAGGAAAALILAIGLAGQGAAAQTPPPASATAGGYTSRFIPVDVLSRMLERPESVDEAILLTADRAAAWAALKAALTELGVPIGFDDPAAGEIGHQRARLFRRLGKQPLSSYLRCGSGSTGPNADSYAVYLTFVAFLRPAGEGTVAVAPFLTAHAVDVAGGRNDPVACTSSGRLERRLGELLRRQLQG